MKRPMLWFAILFLGGELMCLAGFKVWQAAVVTLVCGFLTGSKSSYFRVTWIRRLLPVFFLSGFVVCRAALWQTAPDPDLLKAEEVSFQGKIVSVDEKAKVYAVEMPRARLGEKRAGVMLYAEKDVGASLYPGACIRGRGRLSRPERPGNPGQFDMEAYLAAKGIAFILYPDTVEIDREASVFRRAVENLRRDLQAVFEALFDQDDAAVLKSMVLGDRADLTTETKTLYRRLGIAHILAVSGMHLSLVGGGLYRLLKGTGLPQRPAALFAAFVILGYARFVHAGPATMRAVIMFMVLMTGEYLGRRYDSLSALAFSFLVIMIRWPLAITQPGLQFAVAAVVAMNIRGTRGTRGTRGRSFRALKGAKGTKGPSPCAPLRVLIATTPLTAFYYGEIPLAALPVNLLAVPCLGFLMPAGMLTGLLGLVSLRAAAFAAGSLRAVLLLGRLPASAGALQSWLTIKTGCQLPAVVALSYLGMGIFAFLSLRRGKNSRRALLFLLLVLPVFVSFRRFGEMTAFLDVGQGACTFIRFENGMTVLADGGSTDVNEVGTYRIMPFLDYYGHDKVDIAFVSHGDADHYSGILELLDAGRIRRLVLTEAGRDDEGFVLLAASAERAGIDVTYAERGDRWRFGEESIVCIYPDAVEPVDDINDRSMVLRAACSNFSILLTGDISEAAETKLPAEEIARADVLAVPHHGSKYSSSESFLATVHPRISIISAGAHNRYGHPHEETLERLERTGAQILQTSLTGAVFLRPGREGVRLKVWLP